MTMFESYIEVECAVCHRSFWAILKSLPEFEVLFSFFTNLRVRVVEEKLQ